MLYILIQKPQYPKNLRVLAVDKNALVPPVFKLVAEHALVCCRRLDDSIGSRLTHSHQLRASRRSFCAHTPTVIVGSHGDALEPR